MPSSRDLSKLVIEPTSPALAGRFLITGPPASSLQPKREKLYTVRKARMGSDCGSDHELPNAKFRLKLKKVGKTTRPFMYDLNQIPYDYTVEVTNRLKGLDLIDRGPEELWMEVYNIVSDAIMKTIPQKKK